MLTLSNDVTTFPKRRASTVKYISRIDEFGSPGFTSSNR